MNKLLTFAGQQPIYLGDFDFMQDASKAMFTCIARALMNKASNTLNAILQGADILYGIDGNEIRWTAGVVVLDGELMPVVAGVGTGTVATPLYFHVIEQTSGARVFKDGVTHNCWATRYAIINTTAAGGTLVSSVQRLHGASESDDIEYMGTSSGQVVAGKLVRKNGLWLLDVTFNIVDNTYSNLGSLQFSGVKPEHIEELASKAFRPNIAIYTSYLNSDTSEWGPYSVVAQPVVATFTGETSAGSGVFSLVFQPLNTNVRFNGVARHTDFLPIL